MNRRRGFVLVVVLWILAILTVVVVGFGHRSFLERRAAAYDLDHTQALGAARGAAQRGIVELQNAWILEALQRPPGVAASAVTHRGQPWAQRRNLYEEEIYFNVGEEFAHDVAWFRITDAESRININTAPEALLANIEGLSGGVLRAIVERRTQGEYAGDGPMPFLAVEELRIFDSIDDEAWFGGEGQPGLEALLTTLGNGRININTAPAEVLAQIPGLGGNALGAIIAYRAGPDGEMGTPDELGFMNYADLVEKTGIGGESLQALQTFGKLHSEYFFVEGIATRRAGAVRAAITVVVRVNQSNATILEWREQALGA